MSEELRATPHPDPDDPSVTIIGYTGAGEPIRVAAAPVRGAHWGHYQVDPDDPGFVSIDDRRYPVTMNDWHTLRRGSTDLQLAIVQRIVNEHSVFDPNAQAERVDHPAHYGGADDPFEPIKIIEAKRLGFHEGNALKYLLRDKPGEDRPTDLRKAAWYLNRLADYLDPPQEAEDG